jgi:hypothetical protein
LYNGLTTTGSHSSICEGDSGLAEHILITVIEERDFDLITCRQDGFFECDRVDIEDIREVPNISTRFAPKCGF